MVLVALEVQFQKPHCISKAYPTNALPGDIKDGQQLKKGGYDSPDSTQNLIGPDSGAKFQDHVIPIPHRISK